MRSSPRHGRRALLLAASATAAGVFAGPYLGVVLCSLAPSEAFRGPWEPFFGGERTLDNYRAVFFGEVPFGRYLWNSLRVSALATVLALAAAAPAAYAVARRRVRRIWLGVLLSLSFFPQATVLPVVFLALRGTGWAGLALVEAVSAVPLAVLLLTVAIEEVPPALEEAALVDGMTRGGALLRIVLPVASPGVFATALLVFLAAWNDFFYALVLLPSPSARTATVGLALFPGRYEIPWGTIFAATVSLTLPLVVLVLAAQRRIVAGLTAGAVVE